MQYYDVIICTPGSNVESGYLNSLMDTLEVLNQKNISYKLLNSYSSIVSEARNLTVYEDDQTYRLFNDKYTYNKVFWIDSDMGWTPEEFVKLYESDLDIISGSCVRADHKMAIFTFGKVSEDLYMQFVNPFQVESVGFAFICLKSGVMESVGYPWFKVVYNTDENGEFRLTGEDIYFCRQARKAGYDVYVDPKVRPLHYKTIPLKYKDKTIIVEDPQVFEEADQDFLDQFLF
jgi:GT2 family glycosyltransferase